MSALRRQPAGDDGGMTGRQPRAVASALVVLEEVARRGPGVTGQEIARSLDLAPATAYRLLNLLVAEEYLVRLGDLSGFALGRRALEFADVAAPGPLPRAARAVVAGLRGRVRWGVHLATFPGLHLHLADTDPDHPPADEATLARHLDRSALGRLLLAERAATSAAPGPAPDGARRQRPTAAVGAPPGRLDHVVELGGLDPTQGSVAVAVRDEAGALVAALAVTAPAARLEAHVPEILALLRVGADELAPLLS